MDAATAALATATGDVDAAKKQLEQAEFDLSRTRLKAPFAGRIVEMPLDPFEEVAASDTAAIIQTEGLKKVDVLVPDQHQQQTQHWNQPTGYQPPQTHDPFSPFPPQPQY